MKSLPESMGSRPGQLRPVFDNDNQVRGWLWRTSTSPNQGDYYFHDTSGKRVALVGESATMPTVSPFEVAAVGAITSVVRTVPTVLPRLRLTPPRMMAPNFTGGKDALARNAPQVPAESDGFFNVVFHANERSAQLIHNGKELLVDHRVLARYIQGLPGYHGQPVRLVACNAGRLSNGLAQNLANKLGVEVSAANRPVAVYGNGFFRPTGWGSFSTFKPGIGDL